MDRLTESQCAAIVALIREGWTFSEIERAYGVPECKVFAWWAARLRKVR